jgi:hypothetical protein
VRAWLLLRPSSLYVREGLPLTCLYVRAWLRPSSLYVRACLAAC